LAVVVPRWVNAVPLPAETETLATLFEVGCCHSWMQPTAVGAAKVTWIQMSPVSSFTPRQALEPKRGVPESATRGPLFASAKKHKFALPQKKPLEEAVAEGSAVLIAGEVQVVDGRKRSA